MRIAIFASGGGSNAEAIMNHFATSEVANVALVCTNNPKAGVKEKAAKYNIPVEVLGREQYEDGAFLLELMKRYDIGWIALAGYLKLVPAEVVKAFDHRIMNIHPALLPDYGGKGMHGMNVHKAVISSGDFWSGMTIHYINEAYDEGEILFQGKVKVRPGWRAEDLQRAVLALEHLHYPRIIEREIRRSK